MKTYAIIVTYNGAKWIDKCFGSLVNSSIPLKILVIDNKSTDGTPDIIREKYPKVEVIEADENLGFGKGNNIGLKKAMDNNADYVFLLNQDAWVETDTIEKLIGVSKNNPEFGIISPIHLNGKGDAIDRKFQIYLNNNTTHGFYSDLFLNKTKNIYISDYANAAAWLLTKECINELGGFDPMFKHYGEDDDYLNRMSRAGLKLAINPNAIIYHDRPQEYKINKNSVYTGALLNAKNRPKKHFIFRKIIADYFTLIFVYLGKNDILKKNIKSNFLILKLIKYVNNQKKHKL